MTSALVGTWVDAETGAVPGEAGVEAVPGAAERPAALLLATRTLLEEADVVVDTGPGFAVGAELQPETTARTAVAAQRIRRANRCRGRCDHMLLFSMISVGRALAPLCHRDTARHDDKSVELSLKRVGLFGTRAVWRS